MSFIFICVNILVCGVAIHGIAFIALVCKCSDQWRRAHMDRCYQAWCQGCGYWFQYVLGIHWRFDEGMKVQLDKNHLVVANHQSWVDAFIVLLQVQGRIPMPRIFMKDTLVWLPLVGTATKLMGFPQVKRYSKAKLAANPTLAERDRMITRKACADLMQTPSSVMTFAEGTRFSSIKHAQQGSPYQYLLKPKAGGLWMVLQAMPKRFDRITDLNIIYSGEVPTFWDLLCGRVSGTYVKVRHIALPKAYQCMDSKTDKAAFYDWLNGYWQDKDSNIVTDQQQCSKLEFQQNGPIKKGNSLQN